MASVQTKPAVVNNTITIVDTLTEQTVDEHDEDGASKTLCDEFEVIGSVGPEGEENFFDSPHTFCPPSSFIHLNSFSTNYSSESEHAAEAVQNTITPNATLASQTQDGSNSMVHSLNGLSTRIMVSTPSLQSTTTDEDSTSIVDILRSVRELQNTVNELKTSSVGSKDAECEKEDLVQQINQLKRELATAQENLANETQKRATVESQMAGVIREKESLLSDSMSMVNVQQFDIQMRLDKALKENEQLMEVIARLNKARESDATSANERIGRLEAQLEGEKVGNGQLKGALVAAEQFADHLKRRLGEVVQGKEQGQTAAMTAANNEIRELREQVDSLTAHLFEKEDLLELQRKDRRNKGHVDVEAGLVGKLREKDEYIDSLENELRNLRGEIEKLQVVLQDKEAIIQIMEEDRNEGTRQIAESENRIQSLERQVRVFNLNRIDDNL